jgi:hypothetical protein
MRHRGRSLEGQLSIAETPRSGQDVHVEAGTLRFEVDKPKINWGALFRNTERTGAGTAGQWENYSGGRPSVVVYNSNGEGRFLGATNTVKEARRRAAAIEEDFKTLDTAKWCERYDVPPTFVSG